MNDSTGRPLREVFGSTLVELIAQDDRVVVLDADLANSTKADMVEEVYPDHFFEMGIAEQNMLAAAAGMATVGFIPFISTFACFAVARALDSIRVLIAQPKMNVKIVGSYSGLLAGKTGKTHLMLNDLAVMRSMPNMTVMAPADEWEARAAMHAAKGLTGPVYLRMSRDGSRTVFDDSYRFEVGRSIVVRTGDDVTIISTGTQTSRVVEAADVLAANGIHPLVLHVPTLKPLDKAGIVRAATATGMVITVEEHTDVGGLGGAVAEVVCDLCPMPVKRIGLGEAVGESGSNEELLDKYGLSPHRVAETVTTLMRAEE